MDNETKVRFESLTKDVGEHSARFDKLDTGLLTINKTLTNIQIKVASRDSWSWLSKATALGLVAGVISIAVFYIRSQII